MVPTVRPDLEAPKVTQARSESQASRGVLSIQPASSMGIGGANGGWRLVLGASEPCVLVETGRVHAHECTRSYYGSACRSEVDIF